MPGDISQNLNCSTGADVIIIGAGLGGISALYHLRKLGLRCVILEKANDIGGVWYWNGYPGARVDSGIPSYELNIPECLATWTWKDDFPDRSEILQYLDHCDKVLGIRKHVHFEMAVTEAQFDVSKNRWRVKCQLGATFHCKYLVCALGCTSTRPTFMDEDLASYKGTVYFACEWPQKDVRPEELDIAVIGTGSTAVQIIQTWGKSAKRLTVYQRTYNTALPMRPKVKATLDSREDIIATRVKTPTGLAQWIPQDKGTFEVSVEEREQIYSNLFDRGGLSFWVSAFRDLSTNENANRMAYDFWAKRTRKKILDPRKRDILAPLVPKYPFGVKRPGLDNGYFDVFNRESVDVVDLSATSIASFLNDGIVTDDGIFRYHDIIIPAIGFATAAESLVNLGIQGLGGIALKDVWADDISSFLGIMCHGFPNMFIICGPEAVSEQSNLPTCIDVQSRWVAQMIGKLDAFGYEGLHPTLPATVRWKEKVQRAFKREFYGKITCRYTSQGKPQYYGGGIPQYVQELEGALVSLTDFDVLKSPGTEYCMQSNLATACEC